MTSFGLGRVALLLMLACAGAPSTAGPGLLASALARGLHAHEHSVSLVSEGGHLHLVLAHAEGRGHDHEAASYHGDLPGSLSQSDHVLHVTGDDATTSASRRPGLPPAAALAIPIVFPFSSAPSAFRPAPEPRARGTDLLRPVVLRL